MNNFLKNFFYFVEQYVQKNYPKTIIKIIDLDNVNDFKYEEKESPLHNGVIYLNKNILNSISYNSSLLEIGCGTNSILINSKENKFLRIDGLDIHEKNIRGINTLANIIGSVSKIPTRSNFYDFCISNQSMEHWFEYNVSLSSGLSEIARVLKKNKGKMIINFPLFLHGKKEFLQGNIEYLLKEISKYFSIKKIKFVYSSSRKYNGWNICGQSLYRVKKYIQNKGIKETPESIICEVIAVNIFEPKPEVRCKSISILRLINLYKEYTFIELFIKIINKIKFLKR
tara:strand:- start:195 stop:1046 length:852 start_codon:yes stop_codon:yes gene_type:complete